MTNSIKEFQSIAKPPQKESLREFLTLAKVNFLKTEGLLFALLYVFVLTFVVFPAVAFDTTLKVMAGLNNVDSWVFLTLNTVFSVFDTIGRKMGGLKSFDLNNGGIKIITWSRTIFLVTFYLIAFEVWALNSDWFVLLNMVIFSWSNGYASTLCAVKAPGTVPPDERGKVGGFIGTTITLGILIGSIIAVAETPLLKMTPGFQ